MSVSKNLNRSPTRRRAAHVGLSILVCCGIGLAIAFLDRPAATWSHAAFPDQRLWFNALTHIVDPVLPLATIGLVIALAAASLGYQLARVGRVLVACCIAVILVVTLKDQAKYAFGRLWPETWVDNNPSWIGSGAYGFSPFHGGRGWASFPSGHMAVISAPACVVWRNVSNLRVVIALSVTLVAVGLYGSDYHFVSDILAGTLLGVLVGYVTVELLGLDWRLT